MRYNPATYSPAGGSFAIASTPRKHADHSSDDKRLKGRQPPARQVAAPGAEMGNMSAAMENPQVASAADVIALQRRFGNRAVRGLLQRAFNLDTASGLYKHLALMYHPDKAQDPQDIPWRSQMMAKINGARNDLAALKRLMAEGEAHTAGGSTTAEPTTTAPTTEPPGTELSTEVGAPAPLSQDLVQNAAPLAIELSSPSTEETPSEETSETGPEQTNSDEAEPGPNRPVFQGAVLRIQVLGHNRKVLPVLKKYMAEQNASGSFNFYFDASTNNRDLYNKYIADKAPQPVQLPPRIKENLDSRAQAKDWAEMAQWMDNARVANQEFINTKILPVFELTPEYQKFKVASRDRPVLARLAGGMKSAVRGAVRPGAAQTAQTRGTVAALDQAIDRYTQYFDIGRARFERDAKRRAAALLEHNALFGIEEVSLDGEQSETDATPKSKAKKTSKPKGGLTPEQIAAQKENVFKESQMRYAGLIRAFSRLYVNDKTFRKDRYGRFFSRLQQFNRKWLTYKAFLGH